MGLRWKWCIRSLSRVQERSRFDNEVMHFSSENVREIWESLTGRSTWEQQRISQEKDQGQSPSIPLKGLIEERGPDTVP